MTTPTPEARLDAARRQYGSVLHDFVRALAAAPATSQAIKERCAALVPAAAALGDGIRDLCTAPSYEAGTLHADIRDLLLAVSRCQAATYGDQE